jgi:hypothetical protein
MLYSPTKFACPAEAILYGIQSLPRFASTIARNDAVIKIFPELSVAFQINEDRCLLTALIGHEINAFHCASIHVFLTW